MPVIKKDFFIANWRIVLKRITGLLLLAATAGAQEPLATKLKTAEQLLRITQIEVNVQKLERFKLEASRLNEENVRLLTEACKVEGLTFGKNCDLDMENKKVVKKEVK